MSSSVACFFDESIAITNNEVGCDHSPARLANYITITGITQSTLAVSIANSGIVLTFDHISLPGVPPIPAESSTVWLSYAGTNDLPDQSWRVHLSFPAREPQI
jgi:hypothetical protein